MRYKDTKRKRRWMQSILAIMFAVGMLFIKPDAQADAGTLQYHAEINSSTSGDNITFSCTLNQTVDGQQTSYQWQENKGNGWQDISGATGAAHTVVKTGRGGYQYRCKVTIVVNNSYSLMNECYKAFLHRQGVTSEFQSWWPHLYGHTQDDYLVTIYDALNIPPQNEAARVAMEIVFSDEYLKKYKNNRLDYNTSVNGDTLNGPKQLVVDCYRFLLQREPSNSEVEYWYTQYANNDRLKQSFDYPDANNVSHSHYTHSGIGYVINQIAASAECANNMAAAYYYDGNQGVFLYTESDIETRSDTYHVTSDVATIPENAYQVTLQKGTGVQSVSGAGSYTMGQSVTINATLATGYHWKGWTGTYQTTTKRYTFSMPGQDVSMTASAEINHSILRVDPNGGIWSGSADVQSFSGDYGTTKSIPDPVRPGYTFAGWVKSDGFHGSLNNAVYTFGADNGVTDVLTASWTAKRYKVILQKGTGIQSVSGAGSYTVGQSVKIDAVPATGYHWKGWIGTYETDTKQYTFSMPMQDVSMTADAEINHSTLRVDPNGGTWNGSADVQSFTENYGVAKSIPDPVRPGYTFSGWVKSDAFHGSLNNAVYTFGAEDGATDILTASWTANSYTLHFDPNDGKEQTPIDDMTITYDQEVVLPDATGQYIRYTLDGEDITQQVLDGTIVLDDAGRVVMMMDADTGLMMTPTGGVVNEDGSITNPDGSVADPEAAETEASDESTEALEEEATEADASGRAVEEPKEETTEPEASGESMEVPEASGAEEDIDVQVAEEPEVPEESEDPTAEPVSDKKAYASVFMGWSLEDGRESFIQQWTAGTSIAVADLTNAAGVTDQNGATITLYAVWDDCPWIVAENLYYTLTQAQSGYITDSEILSQATAYDREDGSPIAPGFHDDGTSFSIPDYQASDFTQFQREGSCTENLTVVDSAGSTYYKQITVYVVDTTAVAVKPEGTTRFINEHYYNQSEENGGLAADSIWLTDPEYAAALQTAFTNSRNGTAEEVYEFSHEDILAMKQFIDDNGFGNTESSDVLTRFYDRFMAPNKVE